MKFVLQLSVLSIIMSGGCFAQSNTIPFNTMADDTIYYYNTTRFAFLSQVKESNTPTAFIDKNMKEIYVYNEMNLNYVKVNVTDDAIFADDKALIKALNDTITQNKYKLTSQMDNAYLITVRSNIMAYKHVCPTEGKLIVFIL